jgi:hypothetical protein
MKSSDVYAQLIKAPCIIEIISEQKELVLYSEGIYYGKPEENFFEYNAHGSAFFVRLMSKFSKITVMLQDGEKRELYSKKFSSGFP